MALPTVQMGKLRLREDSPSEVLSAPSTILPLPGPQRAAS